VDAVDVAGWGEAADVARVVVAGADRVELGVVELFVLDPLQYADDAPDDVVVDAGGLTGPPDQAEDGAGAVGLGVQEVAGGRSGLPLRSSAVRMAGPGRCARSWPATSRAVRSQSACARMAVRTAVMRSPSWGVASVGDAVAVSRVMAASRGRRVGSAGP
jgi:hypothetical protein